jgi:hypothetical protein
VLRAAVVPDRYTPSLPLVMHHELGFFHPVESKLQDTARFMAINTDDIAGEV